MNTTTANTMIAQIGRNNVLAISGGRVRIVTEDMIVLPVSNGYTVEVELNRAQDLYTVRRVFTRAGRRFEKGEVTRVFAEDLGDVAYYASCFRNVEFGGAEWAEAVR